MRKLIPPQLRAQIVRRFVLGQRKPIVRSGPFNGLRYVRSAVGSSYYPKLVGCYERELHDQVEQFIESSPELIIDIGAAEGYYACGLARRLPRTKVIAFEAQEHGRELLQEMARANDVSVDIRGLCGAAQLAEALGDQNSCLVVCDIEGGELSLLDPESIPALRFVSFLVETHPDKAEGVESELIARFKSSHEIEVIPTRSPSLSDLEFERPNWLVKKYWPSLTGERSAPTPWLAMRPH